jgi:hypothetical protein
LAVVDEEHAESKSDSTSDDVSESGLPDENSAAPLGDDGDDGDDGDEVELADDLIELEESDDDDAAAEVDAVVELSSKEQNARSFEIRRALEERREQRRFDEDVDYLDYDLDHDLNNDLDE